METIHPLVYIGLLLLLSYAGGKTVVATENEQVWMVLKRMIRTNVHEMPVLDDEKRVVDDITFIDLLRFLIK